MHAGAQAFLALKNLGGNCSIIGAEHPTSVYANHEVMMQYHDWDIILTFDDISPFHNNFCAYCIPRLRNFVTFVIGSQIQYMLLFVNTVKS